MCRFNIGIFELQNTLFSHIRVGNVQITSWLLLQEHSVYFITMLLSPPIPSDYTGEDSHLIPYAPMLYVLLFGIAPVDCVKIFSMHGLVCSAFTTMAKLDHYVSLWLCLMRSFVIACLWYWISEVNFLNFSSNFELLDNFAHIENIN